MAERGFVLCIVDYLFFYTFLIHNYPLAHRDGSQVMGRAGAKTKPNPPKGDAQRNYHMRVRVPHSPQNPLTSDSETAGTNYQGRRKQGSSTTTIGTADSGGGWVASKQAARRQRQAARTKTLMRPLLCACPKPLTQRGARIFSF